MRSLAAAALTALALFSGAATASADFVDTFDGAALDTNKWDTSQAVSGKRWCASGPTSVIAASRHMFNPGNWLNPPTEPCWGETEPAPYGTVGVADGKVSLGDGDPPGTLTRTFPFVFSAGNPFPSTGDFSLSVRLQFEQDWHGTWFSAAEWSPTFAPDTSHGEKNVLTVVGSLGSTYVQLLDHELVTWDNPAQRQFPITQPFDWHTYRLEYVAGEYTVYFDGAKVIGPVASARLPTRLFMGNPVFTHWGPQGWSTLNVDSVNVTAGGGVGETPPPPPPDADGDGDPDSADNCVNVANPNQEDADGDTVGDACEPDTDGDGVIDDADNCIVAPNADQADADGDGAGDLCDAQPHGTIDEQLEELIQLVQDLNVTGGIEAKIQNVVKALDAGNLANACSQLEAAASQVRDRRGTKHLSVADADEILLRISRAKTELGC